jgi:hypothetical protein
MAHVAQKFQRATIELSQHPKQSMKERLAEELAELDPMTEQTQESWICTSSAGWAHRDCKGS